MNPVSFKLLAVTLTACSLITAQAELVRNCLAESQPDSSAGFVTFNGALPVIESQPDWLKDVMPRNLSLSVESWGERCRITVPESNGFITECDGAYQPDRIVPCPDGSLSSESVCRCFIELDPRGIVEIDFIQKSPGGSCGDELGLGAKGGEITIRTSDGFERRSITYSNYPQR